jgi:hypothetical protein
MRRYGWLLGLGLALLGIAWFANRSAARPEISPDGPTPAAPATHPVGAEPRTATLPSASLAAMADEGDSPAAVACTRAYHHAMRTHLDSPDAGGDARTQLVAAALAPMLYAEYPEEAHIRVGTALVRARELAPDDALVAWTTGLACYPQVGCDREEALGHLLQLEADNAAAWQLALADAVLREDAAAADAALAAAARASRYDSHFGELPLAVMAWLRAVPYPRECRQAAAELGARWHLARPATQGDHIVAMAIPTIGIEPFSGVVRACRPDEASAPPQRKRDCTALLAWMAKADALVTRNIALPTLVQYATGEGDGAAWRERLRRQQWLMERAMRSPPTLADWADGYARGEVPMLEARLERAGRWPPPASWLPRDPRVRALVTTGRPPPGME